MKRFALCAAMAALALPATAAADSSQPLGSNPNAQSQGSCVGVYSSRVSHNGGVTSSDQTQYPGNRADLVHQANSGTC